MYQSAAPTPPPPPSAPFVKTAPGTYTPTAVWKGFVAQRKELGNQLDNLQNERNNLAEKLEDPMVSGANKKGLETRIADLDARILSVDKQIAVSDGEVARAAAVPNAVVEPPRDYHEDNGPPLEMIVGPMFIVFCVFPLTIAYARRIWRRGAAAVSAIPDAFMDRMTRLDQAVDSIAVEVERIGEGQRFMTRIFTESGGRALGAGGVEPVHVPVKEAVPVRAQGSEQGR